MGFLDYGKKKDEPKKEDPGEGSDEKSDGEDPRIMRLEMLAEKTGVSDPKALLKLILACVE